MCEMMRLKHWLTLGLLVTTEVTLCSATITQSMLFMLKQGHRVTVRGTEIGQISGPGGCPKLINCLKFLLFLRFSIKIIKYLIN